MYRHTHLFVAAALAVSAIGGAATLAQDVPALPSDPQTTPPPAAQPDERTAAERALRSRGTAAAPDAEGIRDVLAQVAESSLTKKGLDDLAERFVDADRNRLGKGDVLDKEHADLDGRIDQFRKDWKAKYGEEFDINDEEATYPESFARITQGEIGDAARTAGAKVGVDADVNRDAGTAQVKVDDKTGVDAPRANTGGQTAADRNRNDPGRNIATVTIPGGHGMPELNVPMIHEAPDQWKIDIPDTVDAQKLKDNVLAAVSKCGDMKAEWPTDKQEGYRRVTHAILAAVLDKKADEGEAKKASGAQPPSASPAQPAQPAQPD